MAFSPVRASLALVILVSHLAAQLRCFYLKLSQASTALSPRSPQEEDALMSPGVRGGRSETSQCSRVGEGSGRRMLPGGQVLALCLRAEPCLQLSSSPQGAAASPLRLAKLPSWL